MAILKSHHDDSSSEGKRDSESPDLTKAYPVAVVGETSLFHRAGDKTFNSVDPNWKPIPEYEGAHRFDPNFEWEPKEEKKLIKKVLSRPVSV